MFFVGVGFIAADTAFEWTSTFVTTPPDLKNLALYILYLLFPLICLVVYFVLEGFIVLKILGERRPLIMLAASALFFAVGQIFNFLVSVHICTGTNGAIDGSLFETLFTLVSILLLWWYWISIVEGEYPESEAQSQTY
jgi:Chitin synthase export chaperone